MSTQKILELMRPYWGDRSTVGSYVGGEFVAGHGAPVEVRNAHDDSLMLSYADADDSLVEVTDKAAKTAQIQWAALTAQARGRLIYQVGALIRQEAANLAQIESLTANKPIRDATVEVAKVAEMFEYYAGWADKLHG